MRVVSKTIRLDYMWSAVYNNTRKGYNDMRKYFYFDLGVREKIGSPVVHNCYVCSFTGVSHTKFKNEDYIENCRIISKDEKVKNLIYIDKNKRIAIVWPYRFPSTIHTVDIWHDKLCAYTVYNNENAVSIYGVEELFIHHWSYDLMRPGMPRMLDSFYDNVVMKFPNDKSAKLYFEAMRA